MDFYFNEKYEKMISQIEIIKTENDNIFKRIELNISIIQFTIDELKSALLNKLEITAADEIQFFKYTKPKFIAKLLFYYELYDFELNRPASLLQDQEKYIIE